MGHTANFSPMIISIFSISPISKKTVMNTMGMVAVLDLEERKETVKYFRRLIGWGNCEKAASPFRAHLRLVIML